MNSGKKRLRVFAGPNGSGKSTLTEIIKQQFHLGVYVNADLLKSQIESTGRLDFSDFSVTIEKESFDLALSCAPGMAIEFLNCGSFHNNGIDFYETKNINDYFVAFLADTIRKALLEQQLCFSFETVMSHPSKLDFLRMAKDNGYKVYLYFVTLQDSHLNVLRVKTRVKAGGHGVGKRKIVDRYKRTMGLLFEAIRIVDSAYLFDNSGSELKLIAQKEDGKLITKGDYIPVWYKKYVLDKI